MLSIDENKNVTLTRGDCANLIVVITDMDGETYVLREGDKLLFTVKSNCNTETILIQKDISSNSRISIVHDDTKNLPYASYYYDVQLTTSGGSVYTVLGPNRFNIVQEVTFNV